MGDGGLPLSRASPEHCFATVDGSIMCDLSRHVGFRCFPEKQEWLRGDQDEDWSGMGSASCRMELCKFKTSPF